MCGRFTISVSREILEDRFQARFDEGEEYRPRYNAAPSQSLPVIFNDEPSVIGMARWGIRPVWFKGKDGLINVRAETLRDKPTFRSDFEKQRCLVLADGFYEWQKTDRGKQPYRFVRKDREPFAFAGIWETDEFDGSKRNAFSVITTTPNELAKRVHDRMPVILAPDEEERWLKEGSVGLLDPFPTEEMDVYKVSAAVNVSDRDDAGLIEKI